MIKVVLAFALGLLPGLTFAGEYDPVSRVTSGQIFVWRYFLETPCRVSIDNPTCPAGDGVPSTTNGICTDQAVCNPLSAAEKTPPGKKITATRFFVAEGDVRNQDLGSPKWKDCNGSTGDCGDIKYCRWQEMTTGFGKFKNWSGDRKRTALIVADFADQ
jgi:hypothetical protein